MVGTRGVHLILDLWEVPDLMLNDLEYTKTILFQAAREAGVTILGSKFHKFIPEGISGVILIAESHISFHTWPKEKYMSVDIYTCGDKRFPEKAKDYILHAFKARKPNIVRIERGIPELKIMQISKED